YGELGALKVIAGYEIPWLVLTRMCSTTTFETIYTSIGMGGTRPFYGIDLGLNKPNLMFLVRPMEHSVESMA
ncbi:hypothetical protein BDQ17DRAFT_1189495, partial [Cyathus striatus]